MEQAILCHYRIRVLVFFLSYSRITHFVFRAKIDLASQEVNRLVRVSISRGLSNTFIISTLCFLLLFVVTKPTYARLHITPYSVCLTLVRVIA